MELIGKKILKDLVDRKIGYGIVQPGQNVDNGIPVIKVNNIISGLSDVNLLDKTTVENSNKYKRTLLQGGELLISLVGSVGKTAIVPKSFSGCNLVRATGLIDIKNPLICKWTKYFIDSKYGQTYINNNLNTTVQPTLNIDSLEKMEIPFFQKEYMEKAVNILHSLDDKIELNNKINTNLEHQAQALFKNWFVDFEPFGGKMPEGWKECKAEEYFEITIGKTPPRKEQEWFSEEKTDQTIKWVSISDMGSCGTFISDSSEYLTTDAVSKFNVKVVPANTVLLSFKLTVGRIAITDDEMCTNEAIAHFGTKNKAINEYLYLYLKNFNYQTMGSTSSIATAVNSKIIKAMPFIVPDEKTINDFHLATNPLFEKIRENQHENRILSTIRDALLPKFMNGGIEVNKK